MTPERFARLFAAVNGVEVKLANDVFPKMVHKHLFEDTWLEQGEFNWRRSKAGGLNRIPGCNPASVEALAMKMALYKRIYMNVVCRPGPSTAHPIKWEAIMTTPLNRTTVNKPSAIADTPHEALAEAMAQALEIPESA